MESASSPSQRPPRKHLRVPLITQVECQASGRTGLGRMQNVSIGGALILTHESFEPGTELIVRFNLPGGRPLEVRSKVVRDLPGAQMGLRFQELEPEDRKAIAQFIDEVKPYRRRSARVPRHLVVEVGWRDLDGGDHREQAETRLVSLYGGLVLTLTGLKPGTDIVVFWPDRQREARARVVFRALGGPGGRAEVAFEFLEPGNFWEVEFPEDETRWDEPY